MIPQGTVVFPTATIDALTAQVNKCTTGVGLQALTNEAMASLDAVNKAISSQVGLVAPIVNLLIPPIGTPVQLVLWITSLINNVLKPLYGPYVTLIAQQAALASSVASLTAAIEARAAALGVTVVVPPLTPPPPPPPGPPPPGPPPPPPPPGPKFFIRQGATGSGSGSDWANAFTTFPHPLQRGATYWVAAGAYGEQTFDAVVSGSLAIYVIAATAASHGTDVGWSDGYAGVVTFDHANVFTDHWRFNGQTYPGDWQAGGTTGYGIVISNTPGTGGDEVLRLDNGALGGAAVGCNDVEFRAVHLLGKGRDSGEGDRLVYSVGASTNGVRFYYCGFSDNGSAQFLLRGDNSNWVLDHCLGTRNTSTVFSHGEFMSLTNMTGLTMSNNALIDLEGSGIIAAVNGGAIDGVDFYNNLVTHTDAYRAHTGRVVHDGDAITYGLAGLIDVAQNGGSEDATANNVRAYHNTAANVEGHWCGFHVESTGNSGNDARNNLFYYFEAPGDYEVPGYGSRTGVTGFNVNTDNEFHLVYNEGNPEPEFSSSFVDASALNFRLVDHTVPGSILGAPYNLDQDGNVRRNWDKGAFEGGAHFPIDGQTCFSSEGNHPSGTTTANVALTDDGYVTSGGSGSTHSYSGPTTWTDAAAAGSGVGAGYEVIVDSIDSDGGGTGTHPAVGVWTALPVTFADSCNGGAAKEDTYHCRMRLISSGAIVAEFDVTISLDNT